MTAAPQPTYEFGSYRLEPGEARLSRAGDPVRLPPKALELLVALVRRAGHVVTKEELLAEVWPDAVVEEGNLAVNMSTLRKVLDEEAGRTYIETVPKRGYRFVAPVRSVSLDASSSLPTTAQHEDMQLTKAHEDKQPLRVLRGPSWLPDKPRLMVAGVGLVITLGVVAYSALRPPAEPPASVSSLLVMPFSAIEAGVDQAHLGMGMSDALNTRLAAIRALRVPPTAALRANEEPFAAADRLRVDAVLTGSLQRDGDRLRVTAQLSRAADRRQMWAARFDEKFTDIFAVQDAMAERIAASLLSELSDTERSALRRRETTSSEAYDLYLRGRAQWSRRSPTSIRQAIAMYRDATRIDPQFALAYAGLADAYAITASGLPGRTRFPLAKAAAATALRLDDRLAEAHTALAFVTYKADWNWASSEREFVRALELDPDYPLARHWYAEMLGLIGRPEESAVQFERARELDPWSAAVRADYARMLTRAGKAEQAIRLVDEGLAIDANEFRLHRERALALVALRRDAEAFEHLLRYRSLSGSAAEDVASLREAYDRGGLRGYRLRDIEILRRQLKAGGTWPFGLATGLAIAYGAAADREASLEWLTRSVDQLEDGALGMLVNHEYDFMRGDPRFQALVKRVGFPD